MHFTFQASIACVDSDGSSPSDKGGGDGHPDPDVREGPVLKRKFFPKINFFGPLGLTLVQK